MHTKFVRRTALIRMRTGRLAPRDLLRVMLCTVAIAGISAEWGLADEPPPNEFFPGRFAAPLDDELDLEEPVPQEEETQPPDSSSVDEPRSLHDSVPPVEEPFTPIGGLHLGRVVPPAGDLPAGDAVEVFATKGLVAVPPFTPDIVLAHARYGDVAPYCRPPLYFEDVNLERYGCTCTCECLQPLISAAHFGCSFATLPYQMLVDPPCGEICTRNMYPPDACAPVWCRPCAATASGLSFLIP